MIFVCCVMSTSEIFLSHNGIFQRSLGSKKKNYCQPQWGLYVNTSLIFQFRENVISFNFLANALCHYIFDSYVTCLTLSFNTVYVPFHLHEFLVHLKSRTVIIVVAFNSVLSQTRCSLEPRKCFRGWSALNLLLRGSEYPETPSFVDACYTCFSADYVYL